MEEDNPRSRHLKALAHIKEAAEIVRTCRHGHEFTAKQRQDLGEIVEDLIAVAKRVEEKLRLQ